MLTSLYHLNVIGKPSLWMVSKFFGATSLDCLHTLKVHRFPAYSSSLCFLSGGRNDPLPAQGILELRAEDIRLTGTPRMMTSGFGRTIRIHLVRTQSFWKKFFPLHLVYRLANLFQWILCLGGFYFACLTRIFPEFRWLGPLSIRVDCTTLVTFSLFTPTLNKRPLNWQGD